MNNFEDIKKRNIKLIEHFRKEFQIKQSLEEILSYESLQVHKEPKKNRIRFMGLLKVFTDFEQKHKIKRIQLYTHKLSDETSPRLLTVYDFIRIVHLEYRKVLELEKVESDILPFHMHLVPEYAELINAE